MMSNNNNTYQLNSWYPVFEDEELSKISNKSDASCISQEMLYLRVQQITFWLTGELFRKGIVESTELTRAFKRDVIHILSIQNLSPKFVEDIIDTACRLFLFDSCRFGIEQHLSAYPPMTEDEAYLNIEECSYVLNVNPEPDKEQILESWIEDSELLLSSYSYYLFYTDVDKDTRDNIITDALTLMRKLEKVNYKRY
jgi:hypothetical protein